MKCVCRGQTLRLNLPVNMNPNMTKQEVLKSPHEEFSPISLSVSDSPQTNLIVDRLVSCSF